MQPLIVKYYLFIVKSPTLRLKLTRLNKFKVKMTNSNRGFLYIIDILLNSLRKLMTEKRSSDESSVQNSEFIYPIEVYQILQL
jgi:hypothetical protein